MVGCCCAEACTAAVLFGVMLSRAVLSVVLGAWSVRFAGWADWVDCRCFLSFVFLGVARRLELSPCNTAMRIILLNLPSHDRAYVRGHNMLHEVWSMLNNKYMPSVTAEATELWTQFEGLRQRGRPM